MEGHKLPITWAPISLSPTIAGKMGETVHTFSGSSSLAKPRNIQLQVTLLCL